MKEKKEFFWFLGLILASLFLLLLDRQPWFGQIRGWLESPALAIEKKMAAFNFQRHDDCSDCEAERRRLASGQNELMVCLEANEKMKKLLGAPLPIDWQFLPVKLISQIEPLRIDKGKKDGLEKGMVVVSENILVGRLDQLGEHFSLLQTPKTSSSKIPVVIKRPQHQGVWAKGILVSQAGELVLDNVLQEEEIQKGDLVVTSGGENWPVDLLIGQVIEVLAKPADIYKKARVEALVDYRELETVFIIISN